MKFSMTLTRKIWPFNTSELKWLHLLYHYRHVSVIWLIILKAKHVYNGILIARTWKDCENMSEVPEVRDTKVPYFKREKNIIW